MSQSTSRQLNIRVPPEIIRDLDEISRAEQLDRTAVVRRLLAEAIQNWKMASALRLYRDDRITKERAAEMAGVSLYEILDAVRRQRMSDPLTVSDTLEEIERLVAHRRRVGRN